MFANDTQLASNQAIPYSTPRRTKPSTGLPILPTRLSVFLGTEHRKDHTEVNHLRPPYLCPVSLLQETLVSEQVTPVILEEVSGLGPWLS